MWNREASRSMLDLTWMAPVAGDPRATNQRLDGIILGLAARMLDAIQVRARSLKDFLHDGRPVGEERVRALHVGWLIEL